MDALADDLERAFDLIIRQPRIGKMADPPDSIQSRRIYLDRIHYYLYYSVDDRIHYYLYYSVDDRTEPSKCLPSGTRAEGPLQSLAKLTSHAPKAWS